MKQTLFLLTAVLAFACVGPIDSPKVAGTQLNDDDLKVLSVALDAALTAEYRRMDTAGAARLVTPDRTILACDPPQRQPLTYDCMEFDDLKAVSGYVGELFGENGVRMFRERNRVASSIRDHVEGLQVVPADALLNLLQQPRWESELHSLFPGKQGVVVFSSPTYPLQGQAIVYVLHAVSAATLVHLGQDAAGWKMKAVRVLWVS